MKNIAVIPARCGSRGLAHKNIRLLCGLPMMAYTILSAQKSGLFDEIYVSTDSEQYSEIAVKYGAKVPFLRSPSLAGDHVSSWEVVTEALSKYEERGQSFDSFALLQPTSPLRDHNDIKKAYEWMEQRRANAVVGVCPSEHSPLWCCTLAKDLSFGMFLGSNVQNAPRQSLPEYYRINGALYLAKTHYFMEDSNIYRQGCYAYVMSREHSVDVDDAFDFLVAEAFMMRMNEKTLP